MADRRARHLQRHDERHFFVLGDGTAVGMPMAATPPPFGTVVPPPGPAMGAPPQRGNFGSPVAQVPGFMGNRPPNRPRVPRTVFTTIPPELEPGEIRRVASPRWDLVRAFDSRRKEELVRSIDKFNKYRAENKGKVLDRNLYSKEMAKYRKSKKEVNMINEALAEKQPEWQLPQVLVYRRPDPTAMQEVRGGNDFEESFDNFDEESFSSSDGGFDPRADNRIRAHPENHFQNVYPNMVPPANHPLTSFQPSNNHNWPAQGQSSQPAPANERMGEAEVRMQYVGNREVDLRDAVEEDDDEDGDNNSDPPEYFDETESKRSDSDSAEMERGKPSLLRARSGDTDKQRAASVVSVGTDSLPPYAPSFITALAPKAGMASHISFGSVTKAVGHGSSKTYTTSPGSRPTQSATSLFRLPNKGSGPLPKPSSQTRISVTDTTSESNYQYNSLPAQSGKMSRKSGTPTNSWIGGTISPGSAKLSVAPSDYMKDLMEEGKPSNWGSELLALRKFSSKKRSGSNVRSAKESEGARRSPSASADYFKDLTEDVQRSTSNSDILPLRKFSSKKRNDSNLKAAGEGEGARRSPSASSNYFEDLTEDVQRSTSNSDILPLRKFSSHKRSGFGFNANVVSPSTLRSPESGGPLTSPPTQGILQAHSQLANGTSQKLGKSPQTTSDAMRRRNSSVRVHSPTGNVKKSASSTSPAGALPASWTVNPKPVATNMSTPLQTSKRPSTTGQKAKSNRARRRRRRLAEGGDKIHRHRGLRLARRPGAHRRRRTVARRRSRIEERRNLRKAREQHMVTECDFLPVKGSEIPRSKWMQWGGRRHEEVNMVLF